MKILTNKQYKEIDKEIKELENTIRDNKKKYDGEKATLEKLIKKLTTERDEAAVESIKLLEDINEIKSKLSKEKEHSIHLEKNVEDIADKLHKANSRIGGLQKFNNKINKQNDVLKSSLEAAEEKIQNYKRYAKNSHHQLTPSEYDLRLKPSKKKR